jgi:tetratricopeptide (TPR) repeat protein
MEVIMLRREKILSTLLCVFLLYAGSVHGLTLLPPLPHDCRVANESADPQVKVDLYTRCLAGSGVDFETGAKMQDWQRHEIHFKRGNALFELRRYPEALADYDLFIAKSSGHVWAYHQRGLTYVAMGNNQKALADFDEALKRNTEAIVVRYDRGQLLARFGRYRPALIDLRFSVRASPETAAFANELAWLLATCPDAGIRDGREAVIYARKTVGIERNAGYLDTLAAALAGVGEFKQAVQIQNEALDLLQKDKMEHENIKEFKERLDLYSSGKAYTDIRPK